MVKTVLAVLTALMLSTGTAHADSDDDAAFLKAMHQQGITASGGDQTLIKIGRMTCTFLGEGYSTNALIAEGKLYGNSMSAADAKVVVESAEAAYCPEYIQ
jgi:hypothetical protein